MKIEPRENFPLYGIYVLRPHFVYKLLTISKLLIRFHLDSALLGTLQPSQKMFVLFLVVIVWFVTFGLLLPPLVLPRGGGRGFFLARGRWLVLGRVILLQLWC